MSVGDTTITVIGNLTADPDLRYTPAGVAVAAFTIAASRRLYDQQSGQWKDGDTLFVRCTAWRQLAEHAAESLTKGARALVRGRLKQREYDATVNTDQSTSGQVTVKRTVFEVDVEDLGPSLRYATAKVVKTTRDHAPHPAAAGQAAGGTEPSAATTPLPPSVADVPDGPPF